MRGRKMMHLSHHPAAATSVVGKLRGTTVPSRNTSPPAVAMGPVFERALIGVIPSPDDDLLLPAKDETKANTTRPPSTYKSHMKRGRFGECQSMTHVEYSLTADGFCKEISNLLSLP